MLTDNSEANQWEAENAPNLALGVGLITGLAFSTMDIANLIRRRKYA